MSKETISVRISKARYDELRAISKRTGQTIRWLVSCAIGDYVKPRAERKEKP